MSSEALSEVERAKAGITHSMRSTKIANTHGGSPRLQKTHGRAQIRAHLYCRTLKLSPRRGRVAVVVGWAFFSRLIQMHATSGACPELINAVPDWC
jgi:hypothetical protein